MAKYRPDSDFSKKVTLLFDYVLFKPHKYEFKNTRCQKGPTLVKHGAFRAPLKGGLILNQSDSDDHYRIDCRAENS